MDRLEKYVSIVPTQVQKDIQAMEFYTFMHFGINTFLNVEWSDGTASSSDFALKECHTDQWCETVKAAGASGVIITAKHHDGFCLWQTETTDFSIKNSPYKNGKGDIVAELRESCDKYGLKLGIYLSPWDRNSKFYGTPEYDNFYIRQLEELLSNYGEIFSIWLDGACGAHMDGKPMQKYDFNRYYAKMRELQPKTAISNCGPDVRWVGNEGGICRESEWNVVPVAFSDIEKVQSDSQTVELGKRSMPFDATIEDIGSREVLSKYNEFMWYPAEVDVSIRPGWFYHKSQDKMVRSVNNLLNIYYNSVGGNSTLLLNLPPTTEGRLAEPDVAVLKELGKRLSTAFEQEVNVTPGVHVSGKDNFSLVNMLVGDGVYSPSLNCEYSIELKFESCDIDKVVLMEALDFSQRIEKFTITTKINGNDKVLFKGTIVGYKKIALFKNFINTDNITITINNCRLEPYIKSIKIYKTDYNLPIPTKFIKIKKLLNKFSYWFYMNILGGKKSSSTED